MKNFFTFSIVILVLLLVFWISYNIVFRGASSGGESVSSIDAGGSGGIMKLFEKTDENAKVFKLTESKVVSPIIDKEEKRIVFYDTVENVFKSINFDGSQEKKLVNEFLPKFSNVTWATNKTAVIGMAADGFYSYDIIEREFNKVKDNVDDVVWANLSSKILYKYFDSETNERTLNVANADGSNWKKIADLEYRDISISPIPQTSLISFWNYPDANALSVLTSVSMVGQEPAVIMSDKFGADYLWSNDGSKLLTSYVSQGGKTMTLAVSDDDGSNFKELKIPTVASKCVWSSNNKDIFCALPSSISDDLVMPNDYQSKKFLSQDTFWKISTENGKRSRILDLSEIKNSYDVLSPVLSPKEDMMFFINRHDDNMYRISL
ncbi:hypothetical protein ACFL08_04610 [Patescibacteria group bacterium]